MSKELAHPERFFVDRFGMSERALERILGTALERKADHADLYFEYKNSEALALEESMVNHTAKSVSHGVGVRVNAEDRTGYAYSDEVTIDRMRLAAEAARAIADQRAEVPALQVGTPVPRHALYDVETTPLEIPLEKRAKLLEDIDRAARAHDPRVKNVIASIAAERKIVMVATSEGTIAADVQPLCRLNVSVVADDGKGGRQIGTFGGGGRVEYEYFLEEERWRQYALEAARQAIVKAPAGVSDQHWNAFVELGLTALPVPAEQGGFEGFAPDACLVNRYEPGTRLSLHQDKDELDYSAPIVSVSLGLPATFLFGGLARNDKPRRFRLVNGDVVVWGGPSRLAYHGVAPLAEGEHALLGRRRINLTFRRTR